MSITLKPRNDKSAPVKIGDVGINKFIEITLPDGYTSLFKIIHFNQRSVSVIDLNKLITVEVQYSSLCHVIENIDLDIWYFYKHKQYTDKERLDFLGKHTIGGAIECKKGAFSYRTDICNVETIRQTIDRLLEYFEEK